MEETTTKKSRKKFNLILISLAILLFFIVGGILIWVNAHPSRLSDEEITKIIVHRSTPTYSLGPLVDMAPLDRYMLVDQYETFVYASYKETLDPLDMPSIPYYNVPAHKRIRIKVHVEKVAFGNKKLKGKDIIISFDDRFPYPTITDQDGWNEVILPLKQPDEDGTYHISAAGLCFVVDGYVFPAYNEKDLTELSGYSVNAFFRELKKARKEVEKISKQRKESAE